MTFMIHGIVEDFGDSLEIQLELHCCLQKFVQVPVEAIQQAWSLLARLEPRQQALARKVKLHFEL